MEFETDDERNTRNAARVGLFNQIQMILGGHAVEVAIPAICDVLAVAVTQATGADRHAAHKLLDGLMPDMKRSIDNNLDLVIEQQARGNVAGNA